jgi:hypothetical protein
MKQGEAPKKSDFLKELNYQEKSVVDEIVWEADEFQYFEKNHYWFVGIALLIFGLVCLLLWLGEYILAIAMVVCAVVVYQYGNMKPQKVQVRLLEKGLEFGKRIYNYNQMESFWLLEEYKVLYLQPVGLAMPLKIMLEDQSASQIRSFLLRYLPEHPTAAEHISDRLARYIRF